MKFIIETGDERIAVALLKLATDMAAGVDTNEAQPEKKVDAPASILPGTAAAAPNAAAPVSAEDKAALDQGWTFDLVKAAASAFVAKLGNEGPAALQAILTEFGAKGAKDLTPAQFPMIHARLTAATAA